MTRPTLSDVARRAGFSRALVSRALRGEPGVSAGARERILATADELGYRPNPWARGLRGRAAPMVAVLLSDMANGYQTDVASGLEEAVEEQGGTTLLVHGRRDPDRMVRQLEAMARLGVTGIVAVTSWVPPATLAVLARQVPVAVVGRLPQPVPGVSTVANDDPAGARAAVDHLVGLGHRRVWHLSGSTRTAVAQRASAYRLRMRHHGLEALAEVVPAHALVEGRRRLLRAAHRGGAEAPTAVFCSNDVVALGVLDLAHGLGIALPEQLSVVGYDNGALARSARPRLTSVNQPRRRMGRLVVGLLDRLAAGQPAEHHVLEPRLVVRDSTAAHRHGTLLA